MTVNDQYLFITTTWGCMVVVDKVNMAAVSCVHCHADESPNVRAVLPLVAQRTDNPAADSTSNVAVETSVRLPVIVTVGRGHRDPIIRHIPSRHDQRRDSTSRHAMYIQSWEARHWRHTALMHFIHDEA